MSRSSSGSTRSVSCGTASPTDVSEGRLRTRPNAPSLLCSTTSTTVRQKFGSTSAGPAINSCPRTDSTLTDDNASVLQAERAPEDLLHDLVGAAADRPEPRVSRRPLDAVLGHVSGAAVDLEAPVDHIERRPL